MLKFSANKDSCTVTKLLYDSDFMASFIVPWRVQYAQANLADWQLHSPDGYWVAHILVNWSGWISIECGDLSSRGIFPALQSFKTGSDAHILYVSTMTPYLPRLGIIFHTCWRVFAFWLLKTTGTAIFSSWPTNCRLGGRLVSVGLPIKAFRADQGPRRIINIPLVLASAIICKLMTFQAKWSRTQYGKGSNRCKVPYTFLLDPPSDARTHLLHSFLFREILTACMLEVALSRRIYRENAVGWPSIGCGKSKILPWKFLPSYSQPFLYYHRVRPSHCIQCTYQPDCAGQRGASWLHLFINQQQILSTTLATILNDTMPWVTSARLGKERDSSLGKESEQPNAEFKLEGDKSPVNKSQPCRPLPPPAFKFGYRRHPIDWRVLHGIDIDRLVCLWMQTPDCATITSSTQIGRICFVGRRWIYACFIISQEFDVCQQDFWSLHQKTILGASWTSSSLLGFKVLPSLQESHWHGMKLTFPQLHIPISA